MATIYKPTRKTENGVEEIKFPMSTIEGLEEALKGSKITDLKGTTWRIKSGWLATAEYGSFAVDCEVVVGGNLTETRTFLSSLIKIGYTLISPAALEGGGAFTEYYSCENNLVLKLTNGGHSEIYSSHAFTITFIGGDTTNSKLIEWVTTYAEKGGTNTSAEAIIDVVELPTESINTKSFYRVLTAKWVCHKEVYNSFTCYCVETLPEVAEVATTDMVTITAYYNAQDGIVYGYVDDMLGGYFGIPAGWYDAEMLFYAAGMSYGGVITDIEDDLDDGVFRVLLESIIYTYTDGKWVSIKGVGNAGTGINAEIFNGKNNQASGDYSHAEGDFTKAKGRNSHTEGECTVATARDQHVQGRYNIEDTEEQYAHIVGNGEDGSPSNAHTIDWQGNAWFAGKIKVGGKGQDDENAEYLPTVDTVRSIDTYYEEVSNLNADEGITWRDRFACFDSAELGGKIIGDGDIYHRIPIVAGNGVEFEVDEESQLVKINATSGGNYISKYVVELTGSESVVDVINQLRGRYADYQLGVWSLIEFTGASSGLFGLTIQHYGGNIYNIGGMDFSTNYTISNVTDWSRVSIWAFSGMFQPPIPYYDGSNEGQVLKIVDGVPTWVDP